jgi:ssDNA-binding replication factor A large subunit
MAELRVRITPATARRYHLEIYYEGNHIGDYEQSEEQNIDRKEGEIKRSSNFLLDTYAQYGKFVVRWNGRDKEIREYQEGSPNPARPVVPLGIVIPREFWNWA